MTTISVIIVNWNSGDQIRDCLESVAAARRDYFNLSHVVVVDNASTDGSISGLGGFPSS